MQGRLYAAFGPAVTTVISFALNLVTNALPYGWAKDWVLWSSVTVGLTLLGVVATWRQKSRHVAPNLPNTTVNQYSYSPGGPVVGTVQGSVNINYGSSRRGNDDPADILKIPPRNPGFHGQEAFLEAV